MTVKNFFAAIIICFVLAMNSAASAAGEPKILAETKSRSAKVGRF